MLKDILKHRKTIRKATNLVFVNGFVFCIFTSNLIQNKLVAKFSFEVYTSFKLFLFNKGCIENLKSLRLTNKGNMRNK